MTASKLKSSFLFFILIATALIYWPGLTGTFLFDDYPQIVINANLDNVHSAQDIQRVLMSGNAGPGGRGIALLTFAAQKAIHGLNPYPFKLFNLAIHLVNGLILYFLAVQILTPSSERQTTNRRLLKLLPLAIALWWLVNPMGLTSVLYVVQRMTSMAALFTLTGLLLYVHFRRRHLESGRGNINAIVSLVLFTTLSYYSKENGLLTLAYAFLLETFVFRWAGILGPFGLREQRFGRTLLISGLIAVVVYLVFIAQLTAGYEGRNFTLWERWLTQTRVLWFYIYQILIPNIGWYGLYQDSFTTSQGLLTPLSTLFSIVGHVALMLLAYRLRNTAPLFSLGIFWFYAGHSLESTVFPLEMVYEHRNYLPMFGILLAVTSLPIHFGHWFEKYRQLYYVPALLIIAACLVTLMRAQEWGSPNYPLIAAEKNPSSSRANYDAGIALLALLKDHPELESKYWDQAESYFDRAIEAPNCDSISPFVGLINLYILKGIPVPEKYLIRLERQLREKPVHANTVFSVKMLNELLFEDSPSFTDKHAEKIYLTILNNPKASSLTHAHTSLAYAFLWRKRGDQQQQNYWMRHALELAPHINEFRMIYIAELIDEKNYGEAKKQVSLLRDRDPFRLFESQANSFDLTLERHGF
jgi:hypothetical protein